MPGELEPCILLCGERPGRISITPEALWALTQYLCLVSNYKSKGNKCGHYPKKLSEQFSAISRQELVAFG